MIFSYFAVPAIYQHRVMFMGRRSVRWSCGVSMIAVGAKLIDECHWVLYVIGGVDRDGP